MNKFLVCIALAAPAFAFAQSNGPVTRAEVRADLVAVEQAGYQPAVASDATYPADIQAAEAKVAAYSYGGVQTGRSASGASTHTAMKNACVGPTDYCQPYFGS